MDSGREVGRQHQSVDLLSMPVEYSKKLQQDLLERGIAVRVLQDPLGLIESYDPERVCVSVLYNWSDGSDSLELLRRLRQFPVPARTILIVREASVALAASACRLGADDVLAASQPVEQVVRCVLSVLGDDAVDRPNRLRLHERFLKFEMLSQGERDVLNQMLTGSPNKKIAKYLDVSQRTVEARRHNVFAKTETASLAELCLLVAQFRDKIPGLRFDGREELKGPKFSSPHDSKRIDNFDQLE